VYRVPETANILLSGGVNFSELSQESAVKFQVFVAILQICQLFLWMTDHPDCVAGKFAEDNVAN